MDSNEFRGYNSGTTECSLTKIDLHQHVIVIYICIKFHEIFYSSYLVMAPDRQMDGRTDGQTWTKQSSSAFGGG